MRKIKAIKRRKVVDNYLLYGVYFCNLKDGTRKPMANEFKVVKFTQGMKFEIKKFVKLYIPPLHISWAKIFAKQSKKFNAQN